LIKKLILFILEIFNKQNIAIAFSITNKLLQNI